MIQSARFLPKLFTDPGLSRAWRMPDGHSADPGLAPHRRIPPLPPTQDKMRSELNNCKAYGRNRARRAERGRNDRIAGICGPVPKGFQNGHRQDPLAAPQRRQTRANRRRQQGKTRPQRHRQKPRVVAKWSQHESFGCPPSDARPESPIPVHDRARRSGHRSPAAPPARGRSEHPADAAKSGSRRGCGPAGGRSRRSHDRAGRVGVRRGG